MHMYTTPYKGELPSREGRNEVGNGVLLSGRLNRRRWYRKRRECLPKEAGRPAWAPGDVDLFKVPEPVRRAVAEIVEPAYRKLVAEVEDPLERSVGLTLVHLMWLEVLDQHETKHEYLQTAVLELPEDRSGMIDRHLRMLNTKVKVGSFLMRLREMRRQGNEGCRPEGQWAKGKRPPEGGTTNQGAEGGRPPKGGTTNQVSAAPAARLGGETIGECGKRESCHPKTEAGSWELGVGGEKASVTASHGGRPSAEKMKAATQETAAQLWQILARVENRRRNAEKEKAATQKIRGRNEEDRLKAELRTGWQ